MIATVYSREQFDKFLADMKYPPNPFQLAVLESIAFGSGNITVNAKAGSGKTSLLKMIAALLLNMGVSHDDVVFQAFNNSIATELNEQLPKGFTAKTSHSLGFAMCREYAQARGVRIGKMSDKKYQDIANHIADKIRFGDDEKRNKAQRNILKLIGHIMAENVDPDNAEAVEDTAYHYGVEVTPAIIRWMPYAIEEAIKRFKENGEMDFIDQIYMPVKLKMEPKYRYRYVLVDESQDLNQLQQEISAKLLREDGRIVVVGDPNQAVYGFASADAEAFQNLIKRFKTAVLDLNTCYRCPTSHVELAQTLVPTIEAAPNAIRGTIEFKHLDIITTMPLGSMVICRLNAPLVASYFQFIAQGKPAVIIGRDMSKGLIKLVDKIAETQGFSYKHIHQFIDRYFETEKAKLEVKPNGMSKIAQLSDQVNCLKVCVDNFDCSDLECFKAKLEALFVDFKDKNLDKSKVVTLCTVHRAKGLEADHIGLIYQRAKSGSEEGKPEYKNIMPLYWEKQKAWEFQQELNIKYVAFTRAKQVLTVFGGYKPGAMPDLTEGNDMYIEAEEDFELAPENKVYFGFDDEEEGQDEDWLDESDYARYAPELWEDEMESPKSVFALAEQADNGQALIEAQDEQSEPISMVSTDIDSLEVVDERLQKAHANLQRCIRYLKSAQEAAEERDRKDYLISAERYCKDFDVETSKVNLPWNEKLTLLGEENNRLFTWNSLHSRVYNLLGDDSNLVEVYNHAVKVLQSFSKPVVEEVEVPTLSLQAAADILYAPVEPEATEPATTPEFFIYGMSRPAMYGTCPDDYVKDSALIVAANNVTPDGFYVDTVVYPRKLSRDEMTRFELQPVSENTWDVQIGEKVFTTGRIEYTVKEHLKNGKVVIQVEVDGRKESQIEHQWDLTPVSALATGLGPKPAELVKAVENSSEGEKPAEAPTPAPAPETIPTESVAWANWMLENKERVLILDFETTDYQTNPSNFEAVQAGAINLDGEVILNRYIRPYVSRITEGAFGVHGINNAVLDANNATTLITQYEDFKAALQGKIIIAYNSPFDKAALENSLKLCGLPPIEVYSWHDAMRLYTKHNPNKLDKRGRRNTNWSLVEAVAQQGLPVDENAHDALADVRMLLALIKSMAADSPERWQAPKALPAPKEVEYKLDDRVKVKASGVIGYVKKIMPNGELSIEDSDGHRQTLSPGMIEPAPEEKQSESPIVEQAREVLANPEPAPVIEIEAAPEAPIVVKSDFLPEAKPHDAMALVEEQIRRLGSRKDALAMLKLLESVIDEVFPA